MSLPYHYELEWKWHAETKEQRTLGLPQLFENDKAKEFINDKVAKKFYEEYIKRGWQLQVGIVDTSLEAVNLRTRQFRDWSYYHYEVEATTKVDFWTDQKAMGSPIDPATAIAIMAIISGVISLATIALYFAIFYTVTSMIRDIGTGIGEVIGTTPLGGLGVFFLLILLLVGAYIVGKYFWRKRK